MKRIKRLKRLALLVTLALLFSMVSLATPAFAAPVFDTTSSLPDATTGVFYSHQFEATGSGTIEYFAAGLLGTGFSMTVDGLLSGTPTVAAIHTFQVTATDADGSNSQYFSLTVNDPAGFDFTSPAVLPTGYVGLPYSYTLQFAGGTLANVQVFEGSSLPPGLALDSSTGVFSGTPTSAGVYTFTLQALAFEGGSPVLREFSMTIEPEDSEHTFVQTIEVFDITATTATVKGEVFQADGTIIGSVPLFQTFGNGDPIQRGFIWGTSDILDMSSYDGITAEGFTDMDDAVGEYLFLIEGLSPGADYYVRAFFQEDEEISYGRILEFTTLSSPSSTGSDDKPAKLPKTGGGAGFAAAAILMIALGGCLMILSRKTKKAWGAAR